MLKEELMEKLKIYMKEKDNIRKNAIQSIRAQILKYEKDNAKQADDNKILEIISKEIKTLNDSIEEFKKGNRQDLVDESTIRIETLKVFMPEQISKDEVKQIMLELKEKNSINSKAQLGQLIKLAKDEIGQKSDGKTIADIAKQILD